MRAHVLVDYDNTNRAKTRTLVGLARDIDRAVSEVIPNLREIRLRLYGGWYDDNGLSDDGSRLAQQIGNDFPLITLSSANRSRTLHCEMASSLLAVPAEVFGATVRKKHGLNRGLRPKHPTGCTNHGSCSIGVVVRWARRGCPVSGCPVESPAAFVCNEQKLVDTLMCCDLIELGTSLDETSAVFLVSEDDDMIPALIIAGSRGRATWHVRTKVSKQRLYDPILMRQNVRILNL